jgi:hypothetical protein
MRVALIAPEIPDYALEYARILAERFDVLLVIPAQFHKADYVGSNRLDIRWTPWPRQRSVSNIWFMARMSRQIRHWRPDVVHCLDANHS